MNSINKVDEKSPVKVTPLQMIGEDDRGATFTVFNNRSGNYMLAYRKAGSSSGRHYHTGKSAYKDPEVLYLLSGEALLRWRRIDEDVTGEIRVISPARVEIAVLIWHELVAVSDCSFWEMNSLEDVKADSIRVEPKAL
ncbi:MAG TPA: hypothetical protein VFX43_13385 [Chitinophagaceae bacterium]|nr:hypothetical protein [Chitinophagaceae bacterium]